MLKQHSIINFIGRHTEINIFKQWFSDTNPDTPKILYFHDALEAKEKKVGLERHGCSGTAHKL